MFRLFLCGALMVIGLAFDVAGAELNYRTEQTGTIERGSVMCLTLAAADEFDYDMTERQMAQIGCLRAQRSIQVKAASEPVGDWQKVRVIDVKDAVFGWVRTSATTPGR